MVLALFAYFAQAHRYTADFLPFLVAAGSFGLTGIGSVEGPLADSREGSDTDLDVAGWRTGAGGNDLLPGELRLGGGPGHTRKSSPKSSPDTGVDGGAAPLKSDR
jgi:hypothetical protein